MTNRGFLCTLNNPTNEQYTHIVTTFTDAKYYALQCEKGDSGTLHLQFYVEFTNSKRISGVRKLYSGSHVECRRGTPLQAYEYCTKNDTRVEDGRFAPVKSGRPPNGRGARSDLDGISKMILDGKTPKDVALAFPKGFIQYSRGIQNLYNITMEPRDGNIEHKCEIYWGPPGTGKSKMVYSLYPPSEGCYWVPVQQSKSCWFDKYMGESIVVFEEFTGAMYLDTLLRLCDRYPVQVPNKGGYMELRSIKTVFTSNTKWEEWYDFTDREVKKKALARRFIGGVHHVDQPFKKGGTRTSRRD